MSDRTLPEGRICEQDALLDLINGYRITQAIYVVATLGIPDMLGSGSRCNDELASAAGADADALYRVLRALAAVGVLHEGDARQFSLTSVGERLRTNVDGSRNAWARFVGRPAMWHAWGALSHTVQTGETAFRHVHGVGTWQFRARHTAESAVFDAAMREGSAEVLEPLMAAHDFSAYRHVIDVGGSDGTLLAGLLAHYPSLTGTLMDLPQVVAKADAVFRTAGVRERASIVSGSFFDGVPPGADVCLLKHIIHDWQDAHALAILRNCRRAMREDGCLLLIERILGAPNEDVSTKLSDLNMLVNAGGRERTREQFCELLDKSGFTLEAAVPLPASRSLLKASAGVW
jgi:hypothetical protein